MLVDEVEATIIAGSGGEGKVSFGKFARSGPDGGNGGSGGSIYIIASTDLTLLRQFIANPIIKADDGFRGDIKNKTGKNAKDKIIYMPVGTSLLDLDTGEKFELFKPGEQILLCQGGQGGIGNWELRSSTNTTPMKTIPARKGQKRRLKIVLKFLADYGLIGLPNAGKSSLLNELTNSNVKTANYHFTTLSANLGVLPNKKIIADIPGLIKGAHQGKGLGIKFLKHIQKVSTLLHCISADTKDPLSDYHEIREELGKYSLELLDKNEIILVTKSDLVSESELTKIVSKIKKVNKNIIPTSIYDLDSINQILTTLS